MPSHASTAAEHISMSKEYRHWLRSLLHSRKVIPYYSDVIMGAMVYQITSLTIVYSIVYSNAAQRKRQSCASLDFLCGEFTGHRASNTENVCIWWRHHAWRKTVSHSIRSFFLSWRTVSSVWPFSCDLILGIESRLSQKNCPNTSSEIFSQSFMCWEIIFCQ